MPETFDPYHEWLGIPATGQPPDHYRLLGIERFEDDPDTIQAAADRQQAFVRAFLAGERAPDARRLLGELSAAQACLLQAADKAAYDAALRSQGATAAGPADRTIARPTPRSASEPPAGPAPVAADVPAPPGPEPAPPGVPGQAASFGIPAAYPPAPPTHAGPPQQPVPSGLPPGYSAPPAPPSVHAVGPPAGPPVVPEPPVTPDIPRVQSAGTTRHSPDRSGRDHRDPSGPEKVWLLVAVAGAVVMGVAVVVAIILANRVLKQPDGPDEAGSQPTAPLLGKLVIQQPDGTIYFTAAAAVMHGDTARLDTVGGHRVVNHWTSPDDWLSWDFRVERPAVFRVELIYAAPPAAGGKFSVAIGDTSRQANVRATGAADTFATHEVGFLTVRRSGRHRLDLRVVTKPAGPLMILQAVQLTPRDFGYVQ